MTEASGRARLALVALPLAGLGAAVGGVLASSLSTDARFVAVAFGAVVPLLALRIARPGTRRGVRILHAALGVPLLASLAWPSSPWSVSWLSGAVLFLAFEAGAHAAVTMWRRDARRRALALAYALLALWAWLGVFVVLFNTQLLLAPVRLAHAHPTENDIEHPVDIRTEDGLVLDGTFTPGAHGAPGVVLVHGVADGRTSLLPWVGKLAPYHALRFDLRAHGTSEGAVCTYGQREQADVRAAVETLRAMPGVDRDRIAIVGASMGGGSVLAAMRSLPPAVRTTVLLAPASDYPPLVARRVRFLGPLADPVMLVSAQWARAAGQVPMTEWHPSEHVDARPLLVFHGDADETIPIELSRALVASRPNAELVVLPGVEHDTIPRAVPADAGAWSRAWEHLSEHLGDPRP